MTSEQSDDLAFLAGGGEMGALMRSHDWSASDLGPATSWPLALRIAVRLMLNTGHPLYIWWGSAGSCLYNDAYRESIGPERHPSSLGQPARQVWDEIWPIIGPQIEQVMSGGGSTWQVDALVPITRYGRCEEVFWTYSYSPISDDTAPHGIGGVLVICSETTSQVLSKRAIEVERDRFARLFEQAPSFMAILHGPEHRFHYANRAYSQLVGNRPLIGRTVAEALPDAAEQGYIELLDRVFRTGEVFTAIGSKYLMEAERGIVDERYVDLVYQPMHDGSGIVTGIFVEGVDVTVRTRSASALRDSEARLLDNNATLEARIAARTVELEATHDALRQSQKMEAVGQLTGGLAHDFNNLLTGISGSLELLRLRTTQGRATHELERYVAAAQHAAKRAAALTHRLLAFSRRQTLDPKPTDVNQLIADVEELLRRSVEPTVDLHVHAADLPLTLVDANQLESALLNLCINARDAMPDGGRITVETASVRVDERESRTLMLPIGRYLAISVTDTGTGMSEEVIERAFEPFFTTKPLGEGTGLGLSMVYGFARQSGGHVQIFSKVGRGTTIRIYLPQFDGDLEPVDDVVTRIQASSQHADATVLVIDDEPTVRMLVAEVILDLGYRGIEAADGAAGLRLLQAPGRIDLLITDVGLPGGMNGRQVADAGRALRPTLKVLFITGYAESTVMENRRPDDGMEVMMKPFAMDLLALRIESMMSADAVAVAPRAH